MDRPSGAVRTPGSSIAPLEVADDHASDQGDATAPVGYHPLLMRPLSTELEDPDARPYFLWDVDVSVEELRKHLHHEDPATRALWIARVMREARYPDVWKFVTLDEVLRLWERVQIHLGRRRGFWEFLIEGWRKDGLIA